MNLIWKSKAIYDFVIPPKTFVTRTFKLIKANEWVKRAICVDLEQRMHLVTRNTEEVITSQEIRTLLETKTKPRAYWGFECSGQ